MGRLPDVERDDPRGRLDIMLIRLLDRFVERRGDLTLRALHARYKPYIHTVIHEYCGPVKLPGVKQETPKPRKRIRRGRAA